jgi:D,D-heptose 1,7-bisphosphate phosphatase
MIKSKAVFLDRDGTINADKGYIYKIEDLKLLPNVIAGLKNIQKKGYKLIIVTNQSGIGRGYFTEKDYRRFMNHLFEKLSKKGVKITEDYFCIHSPEEMCDCRKPKTKLIDNAIKKHNINVSRSFFIGDKKTDVQTGKRSKLTTILISNKIKNFGQDFVCRDLKEAGELL